MPASTIDHTGIAVPERRASVSSRRNDAADAGMSDGETDTNEFTQLHAAAPQRTPLPVMQVMLIASMNGINAACYNATVPMTPFLVMSFFPALEASEVGFYSGLLEGMFHVGAFLGAVGWGWYSDTYGRRIAMLTSLVGTALSALMYGFSTSFAMALIAKFLWGSLGSSIGVSKTALSELCDDTNQPKAFSYIGVATGMGRLIGPAMGGLLSQPATRYPAVFGGSWLLITFPFLLPCIGLTVLCVLTFSMSFLYLKETLQRPSISTVASPPASTPPTPRSPVHESERDAVAIELTTAHHVKRDDSSGGATGGGRAHTAGNQRPFNDDDGDDANVGKYNDDTAMAAAEEEAVNCDSRGVALGTEAAVKFVERGGDAGEADDLALITSTSSGRSNDTSHSTSRRANHHPRSRSSITPNKLTPSTSSSAATTLTQVSAATALTPGQASGVTTRRRCQWTSILSVCLTTGRLAKDRAILVSTLIYSLLAFSAIISAEIFPLYVLNDAEHGGFGWGASQIGMLATVCGPLLMLWQGVIYERITDRMGVLRTLRVMLCIIGVLLVLTPMSSLTLKADSHVLETAVVGVLFIATTLCRVSCFTCIFVLVANSAFPADRGKVNGLGQSMSSLMRAVGPPIGTSAFAWTVSTGGSKYGWPLDMSLVWNALAVLTVGTLGLTYMLPPWIQRKRMEGT